VKPREVFILAGEASGDVKGGGLVEAARSLDPGVRFWGAGGSRMRGAGVEILVDSSELSVNGLVEAVAHLRRIWYIYRRLREALDARRPALVVLIDFPDFNLFFARRVNRLGIPLLWYVSPQVWAWRRYRLAKIARRISRMMVVFPFELPLYRDRGVPVDFVGHPLVDLVRPRLSRADTMQKLGLDPERPMVALLPGSRRSELERIYPTILRAAEIMARRRPELQFATAVAPTLDRPSVAGQAARAGVQVALAEDLTYEVMAAADASVVAAGTATLECALVGTPMVMVYRLSALTYAGRPLVGVKHYCMVNLIAGERVVPELVQTDCSPERVANAALDLLGAAGVAQRQRLAEVRARLGPGGANLRAARVLLGMLGPGPTVEDAA
jgi:lipid-A-disaccharide synthase